MFAEDLYRRGELVVRGVRTRHQQGGRELVHHCVPCAQEPASTWASTSSPMMSAHVVRSRSAALGVKALDIGQHLRPVRAHGDGALLPGLTDQFVGLGRAIRVYVGDGRQVGRDCCGHASTIWPMPAHKIGRTSYLSSDAVVDIRAFADVLHYVVAGCWLA